MTLVSNRVLLPEAGAARIRLSRYALQGSPGAHPVTSGLSSKDREKRERAAGSGGGHTVTNRRVYGRFGGDEKAGPGQPRARAFEMDEVWLPTRNRLPSCATSNLTIAGWKSGWVSGDLGILIFLRLSGSIAPFVFSTDS